MSTHAAEEAGAHDPGCEGCQILGALARAERAEAVVQMVRAAVAEVQEMDRRGPDQFRTGQEHLSPAFREVQWKDAFMALAQIMTKIEAAVEVSQLLPVAIENDLTAVHEHLAADPLPGQSHDDECTWDQCPHRVLPPGEAGVSA